MVLLGSLRGAPCVLGQLGGEPGPGKPPPDRALPRHGLLLPRGLSKRVPASTRREEMGRVRGGWSEPSPPPPAPAGPPSPHLTRALGWVHSTQCGAARRPSRAQLGAGTGQTCRGLTGGPGGPGGPFGPSRPRGPCRREEQRGSDSAQNPGPRPASPLSPPIPDVSAAWGVWPTPLPACFLCSPHPSSRPRPWGPGATGGQDWSGLSPHPGRVGAAPRSREGHSCPPPTGQRLISRALHSDRTFSDAAQETTLPTSVAT